MCLKHENSILRYEKSAIKEIFPLFLEVLLAGHFWAIESRRRSILNEIQESKPNLSKTVN